MKNAIFQTKKKYNEKNRLSQISSMSGFKRCLLNFHLFCSVLTQFKYMNK